MQSCHKQCTVALKKYSVFFCYLYIGLYYLHSGNSSEAYYYFRLYKLYLISQPENALLLLLGFRVSVFRRSAFYHIANINILAAVKVYNCKHFVKQLSSSAHKRLALQVLLFSRTFAYEHYLGIRIPYTENKICTCGAQLTLIAGKTRFLQIVPIIIVHNQSTPILHKNLSYQNSKNSTFSFPLSE